MPPLIQRSPGGSWGAASVGPFTPRQLAHGYGQQFSFNRTPGGSWGASSVGALTPRQLAHGARPPQGPSPAGVVGAETTPLPTGSYDPTHDIRMEESRRALGQEEGELGTARTRDTADYFTAASELGRQREQQTSDYQRAKDLLAQSYARLGTGQEERANQAGVLTGGALLQAAAKRQANQQQQQSTADTAYQREGEANSLALAKLNRESAPPEGANPLGGRQFQDLLTKLTNDQSNNAFLSEAERRLEGQEAAERAPRAAAATGGTAGAVSSPHAPGAALHARAIAHGHGPQRRGRLRG